MSAQPLETCPKDLCPQKRWGKGKVKRSIGTGAGIIFKGTGFYSTDYRSEGYKSAAKQDSSASTSSSSSSTSSTPAKPAASESKPAAKPESKPAKKA